MRAWSMRYHHTLFFEKIILIRHQDMRFSDFIFLELRAWHLCSIAIFLRVACFLCSVTDPELKWGGVPLASRGWCSGP